MRGFIVLCLAAVAVAAPQGYNYNPATGVQLNNGFASNTFGTGVTTGSGTTGLFQGVQQQTSFVNQGTAAVTVGHHQQHHQQQQQQQQAIVSKRFFIHSAPEDNEEDYKERHITVGVPRKNYNVVFIKSPSRSSHKAAIKISPAVNEEKTVIYVLNKKTDTSDIQAEVIETAAPTSKPEVFFIKYKTNEEAQHAQQQIQAQYDSLGGSSQVSDEGVAPVTSVIGSLGAVDAGAGQANQQGAVQTGSISTGVVSGVAGSFNSGVSSHSVGVSSGSHATNNAYLPPNY